MRVKPEGLHTSCPPHSKVVARAEGPCYYLACWNMAGGWKPPAIFQHLRWGEGRAEGPAPHSQRRRKGVPVGWPKAIPQAHSFLLEHGLVSCKGLKAPCKYQPVRISWGWARAKGPSPPIRISAWGSSLQRPKAFAGWPSRRVWYAGEEIFPGIPHTMSRTSWGGPGHLRVGKGLRPLPTRPHFLCVSEPSCHPPFPKGRGR